MLEQHIAQLTKEMEINASLGTDIQGIYALPLDEKVSVKMIEIPPGFSFQCELGPCPEKDEEGFFTQMLLGNLFGKGTLGSVLGLSEDGKTLTLCMDFDSPVDYKEFKERLEDFINAVEFWRAEAEELRV